MTNQKNAIEAAIKKRIVAIAARLGGDASDLQADELIPASGLIDSAGLLELLAWYEAEYAIRLAQDEITIDNLGTLEAMANFVLARRARI